MARQIPVTLGEQEFAEKYPEIYQMDLNDSDKIRVALGFEARKAKAGAMKGNKNAIENRGRWKINIDIAVIEILKDFLEELGFTDRNDYKKGEFIFTRENDDYVWSVQFYKITRNEIEANYNLTKRKIEESDIGSGSRTVTGSYPSLLEAVKDLIDNWNLVEDTLHRGFGLSPNNKIETTLFLEKLNKFEV
jgi:hypothetical protein